MTPDTPSTWSVAVLRGAERLARQDAARSEELARQVKAGLAGTDREPGTCSRCGRTKPRASTLAACENCREKDARAKRKKVEGENEKQRDARLAKRRKDETARQKRRVAEQLARQHAEEKTAGARQRQAQTALRRLEARGVVIKGTGT